METDYSKWNVKQLKDHLRSLCLPVSGNKPVLIQRIKSAKISQSKYAKMKVIELKKLLKTRKLPVTGIKAELVKRLEGFFESGDGELFTPEFPKDAQQLILLNLDDKDLARACRTNKIAAEICKTDFFWKQRLERIFNTDIEKYKKIAEKYKKITDERIGRKPKKTLQPYKELYKDIIRSPDSYMDEAAKTGDLPFIRGVLENKDFLKEAQYYAVSARLAAKYGHLNIIKYLKDYIDSYKSYVLEAAISNKQYDIANYMLDTYSFDEFSDKSEEVSYVTSMYTISGDGNQPILKRLIEEYPDFRKFDYVEIYEEARDIATRKGHEDVVKYLDIVIDENQ